MNMEQWFEEELKELKGDLHFQLEGLLLEIANQIISKMDENQITRSELARRLNVKRSFITRVLSGDENVTLKTLLKLSRALVCELKVSIGNKRSITCIHNIETMAKYWNISPTINIEHKDFPNLILKESSDAIFHSA